MVYHPDASHPINSFYVGIKNLKTEIHVVSGSGRYCGIHNFTGNKLFQRNVRARLGFKIRNAGVSNRLG